VKNVRLMEDNLLPMLQRWSSASLCLTVTGHGDGVHLLTGPIYVFVEALTNPWGFSYENI
jgi:hypothetical protein